MHHDSSKDLLVNSPVVTTDTMHAVKNPCVNSSILYSDIWHTMPKVCSRGVEVTYTMLLLSTFLRYCQDKISLGNQTWATCLHRLALRYHLSYASKMLISCASVASLHLLLHSFSCKHPCASLCMLTKLPLNIHKAISLSSSKFLLHHNSACIL